MWKRVIGWWRARRNKPEPVCDSRNSYRELTEAVEAFQAMKRGEPILPVVDEYGQLRFKRVDQARWNELNKGPQ